MKKPSNTTPAKRRKKERAEARAKFRKTCRKFTASLKPETKRKIVALYAAKMFGGGSRGAGMSPVLEEVAGEVGVPFEVAAAVMELTSSKAIQKAAALARFPTQEERQKVLDRFVNSGGSTFGQLCAELKATAPAIMGVYEMNLVTSRAVSLRRESL